MAGVTAGGMSPDDQVAAAMRALELMTAAVRQTSGHDGVMEMLKAAKQQAPS